ncbi:hypothetical protein [Mycolicibacterium aromaticivorans]|nr:hypothetical protein [Mycolicibacterium aromaticivorans]
MAGVLRMQIEETVTTAQSPANRAYNLGRELNQGRELEYVARDWSELAAAWIGKWGRI